MKIKVVQLPALFSINILFKTFFGKEYDGDRITCKQDENAFMQQKNFKPLAVL